MAEQGKVTTLNFSLTSEIDSEKKQCTCAHFNLNGNLNVNETKSLVDKFKFIASKIHSDNRTPVNFNISEIENNNDPDPILLNDENVGDENVNDENEQPLNHENVDNENMDNVDISRMKYPVRGYVILLNEIGNNLNIRHALDDIRNAWQTFSSILVKGSNPSPYRVVFPAIGRMFPNITYNVHVAPDVFHGHSYPVCSCPSYHYKSYKISYNGVERIGTCKHINAVLTAIDVNINVINWLNRPDNFPYILHTEGLNEYAWVPQS